MFGENNADQERPSNLAAMIVDALESLCNILKVLDALKAKVVEKALSFDEYLRVRDLSLDIETFIGEVSETVIPDNKGESGCDHRMRSLLEEEFAICDDVENLFILIAERLGDCLSSDVNDNREKTIELIDKVTANCEGMEARKDHILATLFGAESLGDGIYLVGE